MTQFNKYYRHTAGFFKLQKEEFVESLTACWEVYYYASFVFFKTLL